MCDKCRPGSVPDACPTRMNDGRAFTDYRPRCPVHAEITGAAAKAGHIQSSYDLRMFMQHNAEKLIERERQQAIQALVPCAPCKRPLTDAGTMLPERYVVRCDAVSCTRAEVNPSGLGDGRRY